MAMECSLNDGVNLRTIVIKLLVNYRPFFWVLFVLRTAVLKQVVLAGKYGLKYGDFVVCQC